jgi:hypothetical protein
LAPVHVSAALKIHDGSQRTRRGSPAFPELRRCRGVPGEGLGSPESCCSAKFSRHGHMQLRRHDVR